MKQQRITLLALLLALLLAVPAMAAAGGADDPLISRSYAEGTFSDEVSEALDAVIARFDGAAAPAAAREGLRVLRVQSGDRLTLADGQQLILCSGAVRLTIERGNLINCTLGRGSSGGDARTGHRYVAWGGAAVTALADRETVVAVSPAAELRLAAQTPQKTEDPKPAGDPQPATASDLPFEDVSPDDWFAADVAGAYRRGLVNGMDATHYAPQQNMTLAQAVKLAACMHQLDADGAVTLENAPEGTPWYYTYAGYALEKGILTEMPLYGWDEAADRAEFVRLFFRALPTERYAPINTILDGAIPDVPTDADIAEEVYTFYAAGILTGYAEGNGYLAHAFGPDTPITRAEVATIMNRMFDESARVRFDMT